LSQMKFVLTRRPVPLKCILMLSSHLRFTLPKSRTATAISYVAPIPVMQVVTCSLSRNTFCATWHNDTPPHSIDHLQNWDSCRMHAHKRKSASTAETLTKCNNRSQRWSVGKWKWHPLAQKTKRKSFISPLLSQIELRASKDNVTA